VLISFSSIFKIFPLTIWGGRRREEREKKKEKRKEK
jgi:hypothetical protein